MSSLHYILTNAIGTLTRMFPLPRKTGLIEIGNPDRQAPVFLTGNYVLTVERVKEALAGIDGYLLIANSRGINVWCAATGGLFTHHDVISALKTSGIEDRVDHREVILPQLAATGIEAQKVREKTGWRAVWGPVYADDIPAFLENEHQKTPAMRQVTFDLRQRLEMAVAWATPTSALSALLLFFLWRAALWPLVLLIWGLSLAAFGLFPLYEGRFDGQGWQIGPLVLGFGQGGLQLVLWALCMIGIVIYAALSGHLAGGFLLRWGLATLVAVLVVSVDLTGCTPVLKSGLHRDRLFTITLDGAKCKGAAACEQVCPRDCFAIDRREHTATISGAARCVRCGACVVQCPFDALYFTGPEGEVIPPETIRRFKLNVMGQRKTE
jgi:NAD-dependent dihydropyrimidine dehydrogenase PreA subunit